MTAATRSVIPARLMQPIHQEMADRTAKDGRARALTSGYQQTEAPDGTITAQFLTTLDEWLSITFNVTDLEWRVIQ